MFGPGDVGDRGDVVPVDAVTQPESETREQQQDVHAPDVTVFANGTSHARRRAPCVPHAGHADGQARHGQCRGATPRHAIWFVLDDDDIIFTTHNTSVKGRSILRDPRVALTVDDDAPPYSFVAIQGTVIVSEDLDELVRWATKIGGRYMGAERAEEFGQRNGVEGELLVRIAPTRTVAQAAVSE